MTASRPDSGRRLPGAPRPAAEFKTNPALVLTSVRSRALQASVNGALGQLEVSLREAGTEKQLAGFLKTSDPDLIVMEADAAGKELERWRNLKKQFDGVTVVYLGEALAGKQATDWLDAGADLLLQEPFQEATFLSGVRSLLNLRRALRSDSNTTLENQALGEQLRLSRQEFQEFGARAAHDFQECLRAVNILGEFFKLEPQPQLTERHMTYLGYVQSGTRRVGTLLDYIRLYAHVSGDEHPSLTTLALKTVANAALNNLQREIQETGAKIEIAEGLPLVQGNAAELPRAMQSLLCNAIKYRRADDPPAIQVSAARHSPDEWMISVRDNGIGIAPEYHQSIFQPFKRLHGREIPGTGMGLALACRIIEKHGGRIWVESALNQGSDFRFTLPAA